MKIAALPEDEEFRLLDLYSYELLFSTFDQTCHPGFQNNILRLKYQFS